MGKWEHNNQLRKKVDNLRLSGISLKQIRKEIEKHGFKTAESNLSVYFTKNQIKPQSKALKVRENTDLKVFNSAKKVLKQRIDYLAKELKENHSSDIFKEYTTSLELFRKLSEQTRSVEMMSTKSEEQYKQICCILVGAEEKFPGLNGYIEEKMMEGNEK